MYETFLRMSKMVDIMYEAYEKRGKEEAKRLERNASSTSSSVHSLPSSSSHHLNEEIT